jgi:hypothetical protein
MRSRIVGSAGLVSLVLVAVLASNAVAAPSVTGSASNAASLSGADAVSVSGHFAYEVSYWSGQLNVFDMSNPAGNPKLVGSTASSTSMENATNVVVSGNYAFVTSKNRNQIASANNNDDGTGNSLTIVNVSTPTSPTVVGTVRSPTQLFGAYAVAVSGNYAYVASQGLLNAQPQIPDTSAGSFTVIDITDPTGPTIVSSVDDSQLSGPFTNGLQHATAVALSGHYAYVTAFYGQDLTVIDISNPTSVSASSVVGMYHGPQSLSAPDDVAISGNYAFVVNQTDTGLELTAFDIGTNPTSPNPVGAIQDASLLGAYRLRIRNRIAYVSANDANGIAAVNVANPASMTILDSLVDTTHLANVTGIDVDPAGHYLVAASPRQLGELSPGGVYPPYPPTGATATGTVSVLALTTTITPSSEPANTTGARTADFRFTSDDSKATSTCSLDGAAQTACSGSASYNSLGLGKHTFTVSTIDPMGLNASASYSWTVVAGLPVNTAAPAITGKTQTGKTLKVSTGRWSNAISFTYLWLRCTSGNPTCEAISGATKSSYKLTIADLAHTLDAVVIAHSAAGVAPVATSGTKVVGWSPASLTGTLSVKSRGVAASLVVPSPGGRVKLTKLAISLPKGMSVAGAITVTDLNGKKVSYTLSDSHGKVILTFKQPSTAVKISIARGSVGLSPAVRRAVSNHKLSSLLAKLTISYKGEPNRTGSVKLKIRH